MFEIKWIVLCYLFLFLAVMTLIILSEFFGPSFREIYGDNLMELLSKIVTAFIGFLTAFAAKRE